MAYPGKASAREDRDRLSRSSPFVAEADPQLGPQIRWGYPLNLSILISGGKETNQDSPSNGE